MNITRHNYEEYFILYMDNELSSDDRRMVEAFIQTNPDLKDELGILLQYKLEPDTTIIYSGKEELLKLAGIGIHEDAAVSLTDYEEWLVLYTDNELSPAQKIQVENFVAANPAAKKDLELLQKSRLQPDRAIVFANKKMLYRKEERVRALPPRWWRYAAAAVLLLATGLASVIIINNKSNGSKQDEIAKDNNKEIAPVKPAETNTTNPVASVKKDIIPVSNIPVPGNTIKEEPLSNIQLVVNPLRPKNKTGVLEQNIPLVERTSIQKNEPVTAQQSIKTNNLPQPLNNPYINKISNDAIAKVDVPAEIKQSPNALTNSIVTNTTTPPSGLINASIKENVIDPDTNLADGGKKNKLRGFFRKVTRTFEKRTNIDATNGDDRLLVAGLSFKLK
jgi:hypothetical protein